MSKRDKVVRLIPPPAPSKADRFQLSPDDRAAAENLLRQVNVSQGAYMGLLQGIVARYKIPQTWVFDAAQMAFTKPVEPQPVAGPQEEK